MKGFLIPVAATALLLTGMQTATAGGGCGMYKSKHHHAMMKGHPYYYGMPQAYRMGHYGHMKQKEIGAYGMQKTAQVQPNLVEVASSTGSFNTLIAAVKAAGLADTLAGEGPYTVFAPTDEAFAKLPAGTLEGLLADKSKLTQVLTYHVVPGKLDANAVSGVSKFTTVEGSELPVADIKIAKTDVMASNGIIHVIDEVLIPEA
jgi:uncharacterized surface protein with fasciclin (FAS1) repeats